MNDRKLLLTKLAVILVMAALLGLYIWGHNVGEEQLVLLYGLQHTFQIAVDLGLVVVLLVFAGGFGHAILPPC